MKKKIALILLFVLAVCCLSAAYACNDTPEETGESAGYTIVWKNGNTVLETDTGVAAGTMPTYDGAVPTKEPSARFDYTFSGWSPEVVPATEDATYTAQYTATERLFTVTWKNGDTVLETDEDLHYGDMPVYDGEMPTRPDDDFRYTFTGWDPEIGEVTDNATYTAQFSSVALYCYVTFVTGTEETVPQQRIAVGSQVTEPEKLTNDEYEVYIWQTEDGETFDFTVPVTQNLTLTAVWYKGVSTPEEFMAMGNDNYILKNDIDFTGQTFAPTDANQVNVLAAFGGTLNGNGYSVKNVALPLTGMGGAAIFGTLSGKVENIGFENITVTGFAGTHLTGGWWITMTPSSGLIAQTFSGTLENVLLTGAMECQTDDMGNAWGTTNVSNWGAKSGLVAATGADGVIKNLVMNVKIQEGTEIKNVVGKGSYSRGNMFMVAPVPAADGAIAVSVPDGGRDPWIGANTVEGLFAETDARLDKAVWNVTEGQLPSLKDDFLG